MQNLVLTNYFTKIMIDNGEIFVIALAYITKQLT